MLVISWLVDVSLRALSSSSHCLLLCVSLLSFSSFLRTFLTRNPNPG